MNLRSLGLHTAFRKPCDHDGADPRNCWDKPVPVARTCVRIQHGFLAAARARSACRKGIVSSLAAKICLQTLSPRITESVPDMRM